MVRTGLQTDGQVPGPLPRSNNPSMLITFSITRGQPVLTCTRDDGTCTYVKPRQGAFFVPHDLMHYAVETTLGLRSSFFGLIAQGRSLVSFDEPGSAHLLP